MTITLYAAPRAWGLPSISPAAAKLETWLRMAGIPYEVAPLDYALAPKGKMPFVEIDGQRMGDSTLILERLSKESGKDPDADLGPTERAVSHAFRRMIKENLYWVMAVDRWVTDENFAVYTPILAEVFFAALPPEHQHVYVAATRKEMVDQTRAQGMGRHTPDEVQQIGIADLKAISEYLGDKPFFMGDKPTTVDATLYGYLANLLLVPIASKGRDFGRTLPNLLAHCERMRARFFPELPVASVG